MKRLFIIVIPVIVLIIACKSKTNKTENQPGETPVENKTDTTHTQGIPPASKDSMLLQLTTQVLTIIKNKNYAGLANFIDPVNGVRFSPYGYIDTVNHLKFSKTKIIEQAGKAKQDKFVWGFFDGSGDSINKTLDEYLKRFVYDVDFLHAEKRAVNKFIGSGNSLNNLRAIYPGCAFTESHFSGFDKKYGGMDWKTLRLVFKESNGKYWLVGIVHDEWTT